MLIAGAVDLQETLHLLAERRPVFHSEADFQFALAWQVKLMAPEVNVYLESRPVVGVHLDLAFELNGHNTALELKYLTRKGEHFVDGQHYGLKNHSAHDFRRYDVVKDIARVEKIVNENAQWNGAVVVLANDPAYWSSTVAPRSNDSAFRIGHGAVLAGPRAWLRPPASSGGRDDLELRDQYEMSWTDFSTSTPILRQLVVEVTNRAS